MTRDITDMTQAAFSTWLTPIINCPLFESRERLVALLAENADRDDLDEGTLRKLRYTSPRGSPRAI